ncbi:MAG: DUF1343 domain-containing protein [Verrucomicrobium sp.]|nr:DUF1343 domain-containing protein [Verrucomicrobium sp.]
MRLSYALLLAGLFLLGPASSWAGEELAKQPETKGKTDGPAVLAGIDVLEANHFQGLEGKRVGLLTNQSAVDGHGLSTIEVFRRAPNVKLTALFCPEHGLYGATTAGAPVQSSVDVGTGLPIYSLYDDARKPTPEMLKNIDVMVFDIQDIGVRSYTFISTLGLAMEACGEAGIEFYVLDRPNPLGGDRIEGMPLNPNFRSFVGMWDIPYVHGMTVAELAWMIHGEKWIKKRPPLTVVPMRAWRRFMQWEDTGMDWVPPSPHIPTVESAFGYAVTGLWGEFPDLNNGVGYTTPFNLLGAAKLDPFPLQKALAARDLPGFAFQAAYYRPYYGPSKDLLLGGVRVLYKDRAKANLMQGAMVLMEEMQKASGRNFFQSLTPEKAAFFDKLCGGDTVRLHFLAGKPAQELVDSWEPYLLDFRARRAKYLLYRSYLPLAHPVKAAPHQVAKPEPVPLPTPANPPAKAAAPLPVPVSEVPLPAPAPEPVAKAQAVPEPVAKAQAVPTPPPVPKPKPETVKRATAVPPPAPPPEPVKKAIAAPAMPAPAPAPQPVVPAKPVTPPPAPAQPAVTLPPPVPPPAPTPVIIEPAPRAPMPAATAPAPAPAPVVPAPAPVVPATPPPAPRLTPPAAAPRPAEPTVTIFPPQVMSPQAPLRGAPADGASAPAAGGQVPSTNAPAPTMEPLPPPPDFIGQ